MEWSQSDGPWDEGDDDAYPPAPVPAHERTWRHPSELGEAAWTLSEPPLVLGRGLMITTGAIGCALGLAILWLMVPSRGGLGPTAGPSSIALRSQTTLAIAAPVTTFADENTDVAVETTMPLAALFGGATLPAEDTPENTMHLERGEDDDMAIAVAIGDSPYLVTTAFAVDGKAEVSMRLKSGESATATVVSIDSTLAFIQPNDGVTPDGFRRAGAAAPGDTVTVLTASPATLAFGDATALAALASAGVAEGTPVVDEDGAIVALCTKASGSVEMVPIGTVPDRPSPQSKEATDPPAESVTAGAWIGVRLGGLENATDLAITAVAPGSPAERSGLVVGDEIVSIDGVPVTSADQVIETIGALAPGSTIVIAVRSASDGLPDVTRDVSLVLGEREPRVEL